jgi:hypothetical protein
MAAFIAKIHLLNASARATFHSRALRGLLMSKSRQESLSGIGVQRLIGSKQSMVFPLWTFRAGITAGSFRKRRVV